MSGGYYTFECKRVRESDNAVLVVDEDSGELVWIPFSQIKMPMAFNADTGRGHLQITEWIATKKGLL